MSPVEIQDESSSGSSEQLKDTQSNDKGVGENTETKGVGPRIEAELESYYRQSGSKQPKPLEEKPSAAQDQK